MASPGDDDDASSPFAHRALLYKRKLTSVELRQKRRDRAAANAEARRSAQAGLKRRMCVHARRGELAQLQRHFVVVCSGGGDYAEDEHAEADAAVAAALAGIQVRRHRSATMCARPSTSYDDVQTAASPALRVTALRMLRRLLTSASPPVSEALRQGAAVIIGHVLVQFVAAHASDEEATEALWCVANLACGTSEETATLLSMMPALVACTSAASVVVCTYAGSAIGNIAGDGADAGAAALAHGAVPALSALLIRGDKRAAATAAWALSNLLQVTRCAAEPFLSANVHKGLLKYIHPRLIEHHAATVVECAWTLSGLCAREESAAAAIDAANGLAPCVNTLMVCKDTYSAVLTPLLRVIGNLCSRSDAQIDACVSTPGFLRALRELCIRTDPGIAVAPRVSLAEAVTDGIDIDMHLVDEGDGAVGASTQENVYSTGIIREALWVVSVVAGGRATHALALLTEPAPAGQTMFEVLLHHLGGTWLLRVEACWCLLNLAIKVAVRPEALPEAGFSFAPVFPVLAVILSNSGAMNTLLDFASGDDVAAAKLALHFLSFAIRRWNPPSRVSQAPFSLDPSEYLLPTSVPSFFIDAAIARAHTRGSRTLAEHGSVGALEVLADKMTSDAAAIREIHSLLDSFYGEDDDEVDEFNTSSTSWTSTVPTAPSLSAPPGPRLDMRPAWMVQAASTATPHV